MTRTRRLRAGDAKRSWAATSPQTASSAAQIRVLSAPPIGVEDTISAPTTRATTERMPAYSSDAAPVSGGDVRFIHVDRKDGYRLAVNSDGPASLTTTQSSAAAIGITGKTPKKGNVENSPFSAPPSRPGGSHRT